MGVLREREIVATGRRCERNSEVFPSACVTDIDGAADNPLMAHLALRGVLTGTTRLAPLVEVDVCAQRCEINQSMELTRILATNLRVLRELRGRLGQLELAQRVGVSRRTIARLENAEVADPGIDQVRSLAAALGVPFDLLVTRRLVQVTLPLPLDVKERLESEEGVKLLAKLIQAVDETK